MNRRDFMIGLACFASTLVLHMPAWAKGMNENDPDAFVAVIYGSEGRFRVVRPHTLHSLACNVGPGEKFIVRPGEEALGDDEARAWIALAELNPSQAVPGNIERN